MVNISPSNRPQVRQETPMIYDFSALNTNGEPVWYFLSVPKSRCEAFIAAINQTEQDVDIKHFGKILASGKGEKPPESVREEVMKKYAATSQ